MIRPCHDLSEDCPKQSHSPVTTGLNADSYFLVAGSDENDEIAYFAADPSPIALAKALEQSGEVGYQAVALYIGNSFFKRFFPPDNEYDDESSPLDRPYFSPLHEDDGR